MKIFISWAGARSRVLASCIQKWLPIVLPSVELFHSDDIQKGNRWHEALTRELRDCDVGIFCVTPESLQSQWMLFEAGALSQVGKKPRLFTYLYGISDVTGPLGHFQATRFERDDTWRMISSLPLIRDTEDISSVRKKYDAEWAGFEAKVLRLIALPIQEVLPEFRELFVNKKTFDEPFPECSDKQWDSRIERVARIRERLCTAEFSDVMSSDPYMSGAYKTLLGLLSRYDMHIRSHLIQRLDFEDLAGKKQEQLEGVRRQILDVVRGLQQHCEPPVFRESFGFESDSSTPGRKMKIQEMQMKLSDRKLPPEKIGRAGRSLNWGLDRIVFYLSVGSGDFSDARLDDVVDLLRIEEEQARTRDLVSGLQPLYYALECLDERISGPEDTAAAKHLIDLLDDIHRFISAREDRDSGGHIARRVDSLRHKMDNATTPV